MSNDAPCEKHADAGFAEDNAAVPKSNSAALPTHGPPPLPSAVDYGMAGMNLDSLSANS
jgi:hypothetical protein